MEKEQERKNIIESLEKELEVIKNKNDLTNLKALYLGKNGIVTNLSLKMKDIPNEEKREYECDVVYNGVVVGKTKKYGTVYRLNK